MDFVLADDNQFTEGATTEREILPAGTHTLIIKHCEEGPNPYKQCDENPQGMCLKLRLSDAQSKYKFVFDDLPQHLGWRARQLAEAVGIMAVDGRLTLTPDELVDQAVTVEISHYTSKAGKVSATVKKYMPLAAEPKARKPRTQAAKVTAALDPDDIPF